MCIKTHNTESYNINCPQQQHFLTCLVTTQTPQRSKLLSLPQLSISAHSDGCHIMPSCSTHVASSGASWGAHVTQLLQQQHLPAPFPGSSRSWGQDDSFCKILEGYSGHPPETYGAKHLDV